MARLFRDSRRSKMRAAIAESLTLSALAADKSIAVWLEDTVAEYGRVIDSRAGDIVTRKDDYGSMAYLLLDGALCEIDGEHSELIHPAKPADPALGLDSSLFSWWPFKQASDIIVIDELVNRNLDLDEVRQTYGTTEVRADSPGTDVIVGAGAVLTRSSYSQTVLTETPSRLLAFHWQGMRRLAQLSAQFKAIVNGYCRSQAAYLFRTTLSELSPPPALSEQAISALIDAMTLRFFDAPASKTANVYSVQQSDPIDELPFMLSGFGRLSRHTAGAEKSVGFVHRGDFCGLAALATDGEAAVSPISLKLVGEVNLLAFPAGAVTRHLLPALSDEHVKALDPSGHLEQQRLAGRAGKLRQRADEASLVNFFLDNYLVVGRRAMVIDQNRCVGCDECVRACSDTHAGIPRFVRTGPSAGGYAVTNACMHCAEPECMINCPTGAIFTKPTREVIISDALCIGCGTCANACPYDNIRLVEIGANADEQEFSTPVAVKCDLCIDQAGGPACVRACPHDAIARVDLTDHNVPRLLASREPLRSLQSRQ